MAGMMGLVGKRSTKSVKFIGEDIKITKLTLAEVLEIQEKAKNTQDDNSSLELLKHIIKLSAEGAKELSDENFATFPMDDLTKLSAEIMKFSGLSSDTPPNTGK